MYSPPSPLYLKVLTLPPSPSLKHKGRSENPEYLIITPLPLDLREGVGGWVSIRQSSTEFYTFVHSESIYGKGKEITEMA